MMKKFFERMLNSRGMKSHLAMVRRDMALAASDRRPLTVGFADYIG